MSPQTRWDRMPLRLLRSLSEGREIGMVLSGGIPATGRVLYGAREWSRRARRPVLCAPTPRGRDSACRRRVRALWESRRLAPSSSSRALASPGSPADDRRRRPSSRRDGRVRGGAPLACLNVPDSSRAALLAEFADDMARETPPRRRLFRLLAGRVARRRPLLLIPMVHRTSAARRDGARGLGRDMDRAGSGERRAGRYSRSRPRYDGRRVGRTVYPGAFRMSANLYRSIGDLRGSLSGIVRRWPSRRAC